MFLLCFIATIILGVCCLFLCGIYIVCNSIGVILKHIEEVLINNDKRKSTNKPNKKLP